MNKFSHLWPPGAEMRQIKNFLILVLVISLLTSVSFLYNYWNAVLDIKLELTRSALMETEYLGKMLPTFAKMIDGKLTLFWLSALSMLVFVFFNYAYFWQGSKSVYVMQRVRNRWEMHVRCWAIPLLCGAVILLTAAAVYFLYCGIYFWCAPEGFIPAQEVLLGWRYTL